VPVPTDLLVKETLVAASQMRLQDEEIPASMQLKLKVWIPSCLIDSWIDIMFLKSCHGLEAGAHAHGSPAGVIDSTQLMTHLSHGIWMSSILLVIMTTKDGCICIGDNVEFSSFSLFLLLAIGHSDFWTAKQASIHVTV
jgi:hypothetical protein